MNRRQKTLAMISAARLMLRVHRQSRKTGIPFDLLLQAHLHAMALEAAGLTRAIAMRKQVEAEIAEQARWN